MHIISHAKIQQAQEIHSDCSSALDQWYRLTKRAGWRNFSASSAGGVGAKVSPLSPTLNPSPQPLSRKGRGGLRRTTWTRYRHARAFKRTADETTYFFLASAVSSEIDRYSSIVTDRNSHQHSVGNQQLMMAQRHPGVMPQELHQHDDSLMRHARHQSFKAGQRTVDHQDSFTVPEGTDFF